MFRIVAGSVPAVVGGIEERERGRERRNEVT